MSTISKEMTDYAIVDELYARLERRRKNMSCTQEDMAERLGITPKSYRAIQKGACRLTTFVALLRYLDLLDNLNQLVTEPTMSPLALLKQNTAKKRSSSNKSDHHLHAATFQTTQNVASVVDTYDVSPTVVPANSGLRARRQKLIVKA
jgi:transcriptional regulator with XRE-family HTH domain